MPRRTLLLDRPLDLIRTVSPHLRGRADPAMRIGPRLVVRATRTPDGPATLEGHHLGDRLCGAGDPAPRARNGRGRPPRHSSGSTTIGPASHPGTASSPTSIATTRDC